MLIKQILNKKPFFVVGHRGAKGLAPENTLRSIDLAIKLGVDIVEVDVRKTRDGKLILLHDPTFKRVAGVDISPRQVDYEYIRQNIRIDGEIVPTLEEVLEFINGKVGLFIEIKESDTTMDIIELVLKYEAVDWVVLISFYSEALKEVKNILPFIMTGFIYSVPPGKIKEAYEIGCELVLPYYKLATQKAVVFAHHLGLKVVSWTINDEKIALLMYYRKVDGIATDYPDKIIKLRDMLVS